MEMKNASDNVEINSNCSENVSEKRFSTNGSVLKS